jgi:hypothetical protein
MLSTESVMPGRIGASSTPAGTPAATRRRMTSSRLNGLAVPGSSVRQSPRSTVVMVKKTRTFATRASSASRSMSR